MATPRCLGGSRLTTLPPMLQVPSDISSSPAIILRRVDFPEPEGPTRTANSPALIFSETFRMTGVDP